MATGDETEGEPVPGLPVVEPAPSISVALALLIGVANPDSVLPLSDISVVSVV